MRFCGLHRFDLHDPMFELFVGDDGFIFDTGFVGIDRVDGVFEDAGYFFIFVDAHADEGEDAQVGVEEFVVFHPDLVFFAEEIVEALDKVGEEFQEYFVKILQEVFFFFF